MSFGAAIEQYYKSRTGCPVHGYTQLASNDNVPQFGIDEQVFKSIVNTVQTSNKYVNEELFQYTTKHFHQAIDNVLGKTKPGTPLFDKMVKMKQNTARFAAYKTAHQVQDIKNTADEGINHINKKYNTNWLKTEYVHTTRSARSAKKWEQYLQDKDLYPYLEYRPSTAAEPRNEHKKLYGVIKPVEDPFWDTWMPPNDWGCKCRVRQVREVSSFVEPPEDIKQPPAAMRTNPGKTAQIFTDKHPMIKRVSKTAKANIDREFKTLYRRQIEKKLKDLKNKTYETRDNIKIELSTKSIRKIISNDNEYFSTAFRIYENIDNLLKSSKLIRKEEPKGERKINIKQVNVYEYKDLIFHVWILKGKGKAILHSINKKSGK